MSGPGAERRQWPRIPASLLSNLTASIIAGPDVKLVNLSRGGALMEVAARYPMRSKVRLKLARLTGEVTQVNGTVSWAKVGSISNGKINYLLAVIFERAIEDLNAATGIDDVEQHPGVSIGPDPFLDAMEPASIELGEPTLGERLLARPPMAPPVPLEISADEQPFVVEEDLSALLTPVPEPGPVLDVPVTPVVASSMPDQVSSEAADAAVRRCVELQSELDRLTAELTGLSTANDSLSAQLHASDDDRSRLRAEIEAHHQQGGQALADQQALAQTLSARLEALETERGTLRTDLGNERERWNGERAALVRDAAEAVARAEDLRMTLERREQELEQAAAEARMLSDVATRLQALEAERAESDRRAETDRSQWTASLEGERYRWHEEREALERSIEGAATMIIDLQADVRRHKAAHQAVLDDLRVVREEVESHRQAAAIERAESDSRHEDERQHWHTERLDLTQQAAVAMARVDALEETLRARQDEQASALAEQQAQTLSLTAQLETIEADRAEQRRIFDRERQRWLDDERQLAERIAILESARAADVSAFASERSLWDEERVRLAAEASIRTEEFQAALEAREQAHTDALNEQQGRFELLLAELIQATNDQQAEYHQLMAERTAALDEQACRIDELQIELAALRDVAANRAALAARCQELEVRLEAAEAVSVVYEDRHRTIRRETERLMALLQSPVATDKHSELSAFQNDGDSAQAVAGG